MIKHSWIKILERINRALHSPFGLQIVVLSVFVLFLTGFRPAAFWGAGDQFEIFDLQDITQKLPITETGFLDNFSGVQTAGYEEVVVETPDGPVTKKVSNRKRDQVVTYVIKSGDNASKIAHKFGIKVSTLLWANGLNVKETLSIGKELRIPPADGVFYMVQEGDTLSDITKGHGIPMEKIFAYNSLSKDSVLRPKQEIFLPDATKTIVQTPDRTTSAPTRTKGAIGSIGVQLRRPTRGVLTQGYHRGHYALDIANKMNTPIYASAEGKVVKSSDGWNYGYGKYVVIDHGNGVETLYGHMNERKVKVGQIVKAGQVVGLMGNSGNVFGPTGIHLHYEIHIRGRKVNPGNYF